MSNDLAKGADVRAFDLEDAQRQQLAELAHADLDASAETLAALGAEELSRAQMSILRAGAFFLELKRVVGHGAFASALEAVGVGERSAQEAMQIARYVAKLPRGEAKRIAALPKTRILPLVNADREVIADLLEDGSLDGAEPLSVRELRKRLRDADQRRIDAETRLKARDLELRRQAERAGAASPAIEKRFAALRDQAVHLVERISHELTLLGQIVELDLVNGYDRAADDATDRQAVAALVFHGLNGALASGGAVVGSISRTYSAYVTGGVQPEHQYTALERERLNALRGAAMTAAEADFDAAKKSSRKHHKLVGRH